MRGKKLQLDVNRKFTFILDVDGVMTDGGFYYSARGKVLKRFGPEDADALSLISKLVEIRFVSADKRGFSITRRRINKDMGYRLDLVPASLRLEWISDRYNLSDVIYMGDSFRDIDILKTVGLGIVPGSAAHLVQQSSGYTTDRQAGHGAVADACFYIAELFGVDLLRI